MKFTTKLLTLLILGLALSLACGGNKTETSSSNADSSSGSPAFSPSPPASPTPDENRRSGDLVQATQSGDITYEMAGVDIGDSTKMDLKLRNKSMRKWEVKIGMGTKLEPSGGNVQRMVVTKERTVQLEPNDYETLQLEVGCLDISKPPPSKKDTGWRVESSKELSDFLNCVYQTLDQFKQQGQLEEADMRGAMQAALWQARGASRDDWIQYYRKYNGFSRQQAEQAVDESEPVLKMITSRCPAL